MINLLKFR